jgi:hypothetical protein
MPLLSTNAASLNYLHIENKQVINRKNVYRSISFKDETHEYRVGRRVWIRCLNGY